MALSRSSTHLLMICLGVRLSHCAGSSRQGLLLSPSRSLASIAGHGRCLPAESTGPWGAPGFSPAVPYTRFCQTSPDRASAELGSFRKSQLSPRNLGPATWSPVRLGLGGGGAARQACHLFPGLSPHWLTLHLVMTRRRHSPGGRASWFGAGRQERALRPGSRVKAPCRVGV